MPLSHKLRFGRETAYGNTASAFATLFSLVNKQHSRNSLLWFVVEATDIQQEELAWFPADTYQLLSVLLPNKVKHDCPYALLYHPAYSAEKQYRGRVNRPRLPRNEANGPP